MLGADSQREKGRLRYGGDVSSVCAFGPQIIMNKTMYTVEDRGGSGIERDRGQVDTFVLKRHADEPELVP